MQYIERYYESMDWITLSLVVCMILFSVAKYAYPKRFQDFIMLPLNNKFFLIHGKNDTIKHPFNILLFSTQIISVSLFIFIFIKTMNPMIQTTHPWIFVQICAGYTIFVLAKLSFEKLLGSLFNMEVLIENYLYQKLTFRNLLAIIVFGGNLVFFYVVEPTYSILFVFSVVLIILNCFALFYSYKIIGNVIFANFFYFILYLCALEISPYIILYEVFR